MKHKSPQFELDGAEDVFNLHGERTADGEKLQREQEQRQREQKEAAAINAQSQLSLL